MEGDVPLRSLKMGSNRQGIQSLGSAKSYGQDWQEIINRKKTKVMNQDKPFTADIKFLLPNGNTWYLTKEFNNRAHFDAFIRKIKREKGYTMDEVWYL